MANEEQLKFNFIYDELPPYSPGSINIVKEDDDESRAAMYVDLDSKQWQIKPSYSWDEITQKPGAATTTKDGLLSKEDKAILNYLSYFNISKTTVNNVTQINIQVKS